MSIHDLSKRIRHVLESNSPLRNVSETLDIINDFVQQQQDAPEPTVWDQLRSDLQTIYKELVDHTSPANVETFVSVLCAFLPIFRPINVITYWWDLVLRAALRDPRLSPKALQQVKELTLRGLILDSPKATEFRKRIIELYLDAYDETSGQDALERAAMSADERTVQQLWKDNLGDILEEFCNKQPKEFLTAMNSFFMSSQWRLRLSNLLGAVVRSSDFPVQEFAAHPVLDSLLLSLVIDESTTLFEMEIKALETLLPQFAVHAPDTLNRILPFCYAILARVVCWKPLSKQSLERDDALSETSSGRRRSDLELDTAQTPRLRPNLDWQKLEATFISFSDLPSPLPLFRCLYSLYPCNTIKFLSGPVVYMTSASIESPFLEGWPDIIDEDQLRTRSRALLRHNILHPTLITHTAESELADDNRWVRWDIPRITMMCTMLDVRNTVLSLRRMPDEFHIPDMVDTTDDSPSTQGHFMHGDIRSDDPTTTELHSTDFSFAGRPRVSVQDILATYHVLKSDAEIDIVDPTPTWPSLLFPAINRSHSGDESATPSIKSHSPESGEVIPPHVEDAVAALQRENLLLRTELNYELFLKRENVKRIGRLYQDHIQVKGAEVERQGLHNKLREYKGQVQRLQEALAKEQAGATATKSQHIDYSNRLQARLKAERDEKKIWAEEKSKLKSGYEDAKTTLDAQAARLADASRKVFELETQIKEYSPKVQMLKDYEYKIEQLTKTQQLWDADVQRYKEQEIYLDELRSRYRKKLLLIESYEKANKELEDTLITLKNRITVLESQASSRRPLDASLTTFQMMESLREQISMLTAERDSLIDTRDELGDRIEELNVAVETLHGQVRQTDKSTQTTAGE